MFLFIYLYIVFLFNLIVLVINRNSPFKEKMIYMYIFIYYVFVIPPPKKQTYVKCLHRKKKKKLDRATFIKIKYVFYLYPGQKYVVFFLKIVFVKNRKKLGDFRIKYCKKKVIEKSKKIIKKRKTNKKLKKIIFEILKSNCLSYANRNDNDGDNIDEHKGNNNQFCKQREQRVFDNTNKQDEMQLENGITQMGEISLWRITRTMV
ncbi:hypothetical protein RFI_25310 [Reticulomyxa filosa]|uniref:Uncharacterized protein n=1 Tax=Reticulomyxa filosa TaxID=46433 RepID=X6MEG5_RETFI|nr:hypothetical protein RFI_25310 [Reticulomyxa filosa]|eukprot:ETO12066.1 hypothetical protein RFI_25310 [Reticulomyxa filosa]